MEISLQRLSTEHNRPGVFGFLWKFDEYEFVVPLTENLTNSEIVKLVEFIKILDSSENQNQAWKYLLQSKNEDIVQKKIVEFLSTSYMEAKKLSRKEKDFFGYKVLYMALNIMAASIAEGGVEPIINLLQKRDQKRLHRYHTFDYARNALPEEGFEIDSNRIRVLIFFVALIVCGIYLYYFDKFLNYWEIG